MTGKQLSRAEIYGVVYRVYDCDVFTREFLTSQGIDVNEPESAPPDPYTEERRLNWRREVQPCKAKTERAIADDKRYLFLEFDGMILTFDVLWDERKYKLRYFLADDTIAIMAVRGPADPVEGKGLLLKRTKVPRDWSDAPTTFPSAYLEKTDNEIKGYYGPADIKVSCDHVYESTTIDTGFCCDDDNGGRPTVTPRERHSIVIL